MMGVTRSRTKIGKRANFGAKVIPALFSHIGPCFYNRTMHGLLILKLLSLSLLP